MSSYEIAPGKERGWHKDEIYLKEQAAKKARLITPPTPEPPQPTLLEVMEKLNQQAKILEAIQEYLMEVPTVKTYKHPFKDPEVKAKALAAMAKTREAQKEELTKRRTERYAKLNAKLKKALEQYPLGVVKSLTTAQIALIAGLPATTLQQYPAADVKSFNISGRKGEGTI